MCCVRRFRATQLLFLLAERRPAAGGRLASLRQRFERRARFPLLLLERPDFARDALHQRRAMLAERPLTGRAFALGAQFVNLSQVFLSVHQLAAVGRERGIQLPLPGGEFL